MDDKELKIIESLNRKLDQLERKIVNQDEYILRNRKTKGHEVVLKMEQPEEPVVKNEIVTLTKTIQEKLDALKGVLDTQGKAREERNLKQDETTIQGQEQMKQVVAAIKAIRFPSFPKIPQPESLGEVQRLLKQLVEHHQVKPVSEEELASLVDYEDPKQIYIGQAKAGASEDEKAWRIKRVRQEDKTSVTQWADGNADFDNSWSKRNTLKYG